MTTRDETFERTLRSWMTDEASEDGADRIQASVIGAARGRRQRQMWSVALRGTTWDRAPGQKRSMPSPRILIVVMTLVATVIGLGVMGSGAFRSDDGLSAPVPSASPSASAAPAATPRATPRVDAAAPIPSWPPYDLSIVTYLVGHGQSVRPVPGAVPDDYAYTRLRTAVTGGFASTYYALVTCVDPSKGCDEVGSTVVGDQRGIWFIYSQFVRAIDAVTLERIPMDGY